MRSYWRVIWSHGRGYSRGLFSGAESSDEQSMIVKGNVNKDQDKESRDP